MCVPVRPPIRRDRRAHPAPSDRASPRARRSRVLAIRVIRAHNTRRETRHRRAGPCGSRRTSRSTARSASTRCASASSTCAGTSSGRSRTSACSATRRAPRGRRRPPPRRERAAAAAKRRRPLLPLNTHDDDASRTPPSRAVRRARLLGQRDQEARQPAALAAPEHAPAFEQPRRARRRRAVEPGAQPRDARAHAQPPRAPRRRRAAGRVVARRVARFYREEAKKLREAALLPLAPSPLDAQARARASPSSRSSATPSRASRTTGCS